MFWWKFLIKETLRRWLCAQCSFLSPHCRAQFWKVELLLSHSRKMIRFLFSFFLKYLWRWVLWQSFLVFHKPCSSETICVASEQWAGCEGYLGPGFSSATNLWTGWPRQAQPHFPASIPSQLYLASASLVPSPLGPLSQWLKVTRVEQVWEFSTLKTFNFIFVYIL